MKNLFVSMKKIVVPVTLVAVAAVLTWTASDTLRLWVDVTPAAAQVVIPPPPAAWTAIGASGSVDESSIPIFGFTNASAHYGPNGSLQPLEFRYNVVNVQHQISSTGGIPTVAIPAWTTLEFGAQAPATSVAEAFLYRVNRCTGQQTLICQIRHNAQPAPGTCKTCTFANNTFNFSSYLYYVRVILDRNTPNELPMAHTLRIY